ncbi:hypothetical protein F2P81_018149 [Scophthalmus maximus]|uniref:Endonuclease domain-containing 1 protein-like n=1 Tax=Scophthalmus maximus TaxID=52904 RepID=A0A6A4SDR9_SCOMX|nr:hypothetical protein F2P81_018149 [Scophthalmus maximus]
MLRLPPLAALVLLFSSIGPSVAEVVPLIAQCQQFFLQNNPPEIPGILVGGNILNQNRYKPICQTLASTVTFVTLYDITNKIPVFSAYKYNGISLVPRPKTIWKIEPQLENPNNNANMRKDNGGVYNNQAGTKDYNNQQGFDRGHLLPSCYGFSQDDKKSTFTLTNIVPQVDTFNQGSWSNMENCVKCIMDLYCVNNNGVTEGYVVIGAQPGNNFLKNKMNIPSMLWSAFCCYSHSQGMWIASAYLGDNIPNQPVHLPTQTLTYLTSQLGSVPFPASQCPPMTVVTHLYPTVAPQCQC